MSKRRRTSVGKLSEVNVYVVSLCRVWIRLEVFPESSLLVHAIGLTECVLDLFTGREEGGLRLWWHTCKLLKSQNWIINEVLHVVSNVLGWIDFPTWTTKAERSRSLVLDNMVFIPCDCDLVTLNPVLQFLIDLEGVAALNGFLQLNGGIVLLHDEVSLVTRERKHKHLAMLRETRGKGVSVHVVQFLGLGDNLAVLIELQRTLCVESSNLVKYDGDGVIAL